MSGLYPQCCKKRHYHVLMPKYGKAQLNTVFIVLKTYQQAYQAGPSFSSGGR